MQMILFSFLLEQPNKHKKRKKASPCTHEVNKKQGEIKKINKSETQFSRKEV